ncbi:MAG: DUF3034 family protein [Salinisphaera sp.]|jgi:hypothetical protein|nr:DUF3034 family protein [Salinisphaera sp.]
MTQKPCSKPLHRLIRVFAPTALIVVGVLGITANAHAAGSRLWATGGITSVNGAAGGGTTTWALLNGYASDNQSTVNISPSTVRTDDLNINSLGIGFDWHNRVGLTLAENMLHVQPLHTNIRQQNLGLKVRLYGEALYSPLGQFSAGARYTHNSDFAIPRRLGASDASGVDYYLAWSKVFLAAIAGRNVLLNATARATRANQIGLLGFGGDRNNGYDVLGEFGAGVFLDPHWLIGGEYKQQPNNLSAVNADEWKTIFVAYVPNHYLAITGAYVDLGAVAGLTHQTGYFISLQTGF